jgi:DNA-binding transcriptional regulator YdaS (Cro superfamily)
MEQQHVSALRRAVEIAGSQGQLAKRMRAYFTSRGIDSAISQQTISYWLQSATLIDAMYWPAIEDATDGRVTRYDLRPDVFGERPAVA